MIKALQLILFIALSITAAYAHASGDTASVAIHAPYTNAEAFARGLPPLRPRRQGTRTWTAAKRQPSPVRQSVLLNFDDPELSGNFNHLPAINHGVKFECPDGVCYYIKTTGYPSYTSNAAPNAMYMQDTRYNPTLSNAAPGGLLHLKSMYCTHASSTAGGSPSPVYVRGVSAGILIYEETASCARASNPPLFNSWINLPAVQSITFSAPDFGGWAIDDIALDLLH